LVVFFEVEVDSHPLWGWESKEASLSLRMPPYGGRFFCAARGVKEENGYLNFLA